MTRDEQERQRAALRRRARALYDRGLTIDQVGAQIGRCRSVTYRLLSETPGWVPPSQASGSRRPWSAEEDRTLCEAIELIASRMGRSTGSVINRARLVVG